MTKPTIFFSHSSLDRLMLGKLKELFEVKTGCSIDVFLSSDGQSIKFGTNWVHRVEQALQEASMMFVFVNPNSLHSNWLHFESGFAYSRAIEVVPVGLGIDLTSAGAPLSLLQGFNISSAAGLNNLIAVANAKFAHKHAEDFNDNDWQAVFSNSEFPGSTTFGKHFPLVYEITITIGPAGINGRSSKEALRSIELHLSEQNIEHITFENKLELQGMVIYTTQSESKDAIAIQISPNMFDIVMPMLNRLANNLSDSGMLDYSFQIGFDPCVQSENKLHRITGLLYGAGVAILDQLYMSFRSLDFRMLQMSRVIRAGERIAATYVVIQSHEKSLALGDIGSLFDLLFERRVLSVE